MEEGDRKQLDTFCSYQNILKVLDNWFLGFFRLNFIGVFILLGEELELNLKIQTLLTDK